MLGTTVPEPVKCYMVYGYSIELCMISEMASCSTLVSMVIRQAALWIMLVLLVI